MSRHSETLSARGALPTVAGERVNLQLQGPNGYLLDMAYGVGYTDYVRLPWNIKMLRGPRGFRLLPDGAFMMAAYKSLIETYMQSWTGFNRTLTVNTSETQIGWSGEVFQTPTRVSRARTNLQSTVVEKDGRPIITLLEDLVRIFIFDADVGHPLIAGMSNSLTDKLHDMYSCDLIAWEYDKTHRKPINAVLLTNVFPINEIGENTGTREIQQEGGTVTYNLQWACWQKVGYAVDQLAQQFIDSARVTGIDPGFVQNHIQNVDPAVAAANRFGLLDQINQLKRQLVTPA